MLSGTPIPRSPGLYRHSLADKTPKRRRSWTRSGVWGQTRGVGPQDDLGGPKPDRTADLNANRTPVQAKFGQLPAVRCRIEAAYMSSGRPLPAAAARRNKPRMRPWGPARRRHGGHSAVGASPRSCGIQTASSKLLDLLRKPGAPPSGNSGETSPWRLSAARKARRGSQQVAEKAQPLSLLQAKPSPTRPGNDPQVSQRRGWRERWAWSHKARTSGTSTRPEGCRACLTDWVSMTQMPFGGVTARPSFDSFLMAVGREKSVSAMYSLPRRPPPAEVKIRNGNHRQRSRRP